MQVTSRQGLNICSNIGSNSPSTNMNTARALSKLYRRQLVLDLPTGCNPALALREPLCPRIPFLSSIALGEEVAAQGLARQPFKFIRRGTIAGVLPPIR